MKKLFAFLLVLALMLCAVGCQNSNDPVYAIKKAYIEQRIPEYMRDDFTPDMIPIWSYGTYNGCTVGYFCSKGSGAQAIRSEKVGNYVFTYPSSDKMEAYKDGIIKFLPEAYELGWFDDEALAQIYDNFINGRYTLYE